MSFFKKSKPAIPARYSENSQGDFYVENGVCTSCGAPQVEAPDLIEHSTLEYGHCYFKKQPQTEGEIERAINAIAVSCISGLRYGGTNEKILKRLYEIGESEQCDNKPIGKYKRLIFDNLIFQFNGSIQELSNLLTTELVKGNTYLNKQILNHNFDRIKYFEFIYRWTDGLTGNTFRCFDIGENKFRVEIGVEKDGFEISIRGNAITLNSILQQDDRVSNILWFDKDKNEYKDTELQ